jgi:Flp pilus assembly protein TadG
MGERCMPATRRKRCHEERGAAAVEFALVAPILFSLVFGIIGFGFVFAQELSLGNGARQGARYGVVVNRTCSDIFSETRSGSQTINLNPSQIRIVVTLGTNESTASTKCDSQTSATDSVEPCSGSTTGDNLYVYANFKSTVSVPLLPISGQVPLQGKGVFRCEYS